MNETIYSAKAAACFGAAIAIGIGTLGPSLAQGAVGAKACENIGKYPDSYAAIRNAMAIALVTIETSSIYALLIALGLLYVAMA